MDLHNKNWFKHENKCTSFLDLRKSCLAICKHWEATEGEMHMYRGMLFVSGAKASSVFEHLVSDFSNQIGLH